MQDSSESHLFSTSLLMHCPHLTHPLSLTIERMDGAVQVAELITVRRIRGSTKWTRTILARRTGTGGETVVTTTDAKKTTRGIPARRSFCQPACRHTSFKGDWAQEDHVVTAQTSSSSRADACTSSVGKAYNLCIIQSWVNVTRINCECTQSEAHGLPTWECVATATCKK